MAIDQGLARFIGVRRAGRAVDRALGAARSAVLPGISVGALDAIAAASLRRSGAESAMLGYDDGLGGGAFPLHLSVSVNDEIAGACDPDRVLEPGDLVTLDLAARVLGWHADAALTLCVDPRGGATSPVEAAGERGGLARASRLVTIAGVRSVGRLGSWDAAVGMMHLAADRLGVRLLRGYFGHGIGRAMHEPPALGHHRSDLTAGAEAVGRALAVGSVFTIEPVIAWADTDVVRDGWLDRTSDGCDACFCEVTVGVGVRRVEVLAGRGNLLFGAS